MRRGALAAVLLASLSPGGARAQERAAAGQVVRIDLAQCIDLALKNNHDVSIAQIAPRISGAELMGAEGKFDIGVEAKSKFSREENPSLSIIDIFGGLDEKKKFDLGVSVSKLFASGAEVALTFDVDRQSSNSFFQTVDPAWSPRFGVKITQPLLKNFGIDVNTADLQLARNNRRIALFEFENQIRKTVGKVSDLYWELVYSVHELGLKREALAFARSILAITESKRRLDLVFPLQVLQVQVEVARREEEILTARERLRDVEDRLMLEILPAGRVLDGSTRLEATEKFEFRRFDVDLGESVRLSLAHRPDIKSARARVRSREIEQRRARNRLLPDVGLSATYGFRAIDDSFTGSVEKAVRLDFPFWEVGLEVKIPLGNRVARGAYRKARLELTRSNLELANLGRTVVLEVRRSVREVQTGAKRILAARAARKLSEEQLGLERAQFEKGIKKTNRLVIEYQKEVIEAKNLELKALLRHKKAMVRLEIAKSASLALLLKRLVAQQ